jgi:hypothetical protein
MMDVFQFIAANFWILLGMCGVVFLLGMFLWFMGNAMVREGEKRLQAIADREATYARAGLLPPELRGEPTDCLYPPVPGAAYDPIDDYR